MRRLHTRRLHTHTHTLTHTRTHARANILMFRCWQTAVLSFGFPERFVYFIFAACGKNLRCFIFAACGKKNWGFCFRRLRRKFWGLLFMQHETAGGDQPERALGLSLGFCVVSSLRYMIYIYIYVKYSYYKHALFTCLGAFWSKNRLKSGRLAWIAPLYVSFMILKTIMTRMTTT